MRPDLKEAKENLAGHSICLVKGESILTHDGRGISPMMELLGQNMDLAGYSVADLIVGKAAAMLFVKAGIVSVYGKVMSQAGYDYLKAYGIEAEYETLTEKIINRKGDDVCPMEKTVASLENVEDGYLALKETMQKLRTTKK